MLKVPRVQEIKTSKDLDRANQSQSRFNVGVIDQLERRSALEATVLPSIPCGIRPSLHIRPEVAAQRLTCIVIGLNS